MTDTLITPALRCHVERAACELDTHEFDEGTNHATYNRLYSEAIAESAPFRKALAEAIYLYGNAHLRGSRAFDNCFEMCDVNEIEIGRASCRESGFQCVSISVVAGKLK